MVLLIASNAEVNSRDQAGATSLHDAALSGSANIVDILLSSHADVNARNSDGDTPLLLSEEDDHANIAQLLVAHGGDVNLRDNKGDDVLHWAARDGRLEFTQLLLARHAEVNASNNAGKSPAPRHILRPQRYCSIAAQKPRALIAIIVCLTLRFVGVRGRRLSLRGNVRSPRELNEQLQANDACATCGR